jgi:hypothetical protein
MLSYLYALIASLGFAGGNYIASELSIKYGFVWYYATCIAGPLMWIVYHPIKHFQNNLKRESQGIAKASFFQKETCIYFKLDETTGKYKVHWRNVRVPLSRMMV